VVYISTHSSDGRVKYLAALEEVAHKTGRRLVIIRVNTFDEALLELRKLQPGSVDKLVLAPDHGVVPDGYPHDIPKEHMPRVMFGKRVTPGHKLAAFLAHAYYVTRIPHVHLDTCVIMACANALYDAAMAAAVKNDADLAGGTQAGSSRTLTGYDTEAADCEFSSCRAYILRGLPTRPDRSAHAGKRVVVRIASLATHKVQRAVAHYPPDVKTVFKLFDANATAARAAAQRRAKAAASFAPIDRVVSWEDAARTRVLVRSVGIEGVWPRTVESLNRAGCVKFREFERLDVEARIARRSRAVRASVSGIASIGQELSTHNNQGAKAETRVANRTATSNGVHSRRMLRSSSSVFPVQHRQGEEVIVFKAVKAVLVAAAKASKAATQAVKMVAKRRAGK
jgi:hypothetical protein